MEQVTVVCEQQGCINAGISIEVSAAPGGKVICGPCGSELVEMVPGEVVLTWDNIRSVRDGLLAASDWTQLADAPVDAAAWAVYRQTLRDIPQDFATPDAVVWPEQP